MFSSEYYIYIYMYNIYIYTGCMAQKKYSSLIQYNLKSKRALTLKRGLYSVMSNLNFGILHVHFNTLLTEITAFKFELTFLEMSKIQVKKTAY